MAISSIKLPDNTTQDIHDSRISEASSSDNGKVLGVTDSSGTLGWVAQPSVPVTDVTVGGTSVVSGGTAVIPAISTVPTISTNIDDDKTDNTKTASPAAVYNEVHPEIITTWPSNNTFTPNKMYQITANVTGTKNVTLPFADLNFDITNHWYISFKTGSIAPTITWSSAIVWYGSSAPTISANKHYEVSILYNDGLQKYIGICIETEKS